MIRTSDGNLVLFGQDFTEDGPGGAWFVTKIDPQGGRIWEEVISFPVDLVEIEEGPDGTIFVTGAVGRPGGDRPFLLSLSPEGELNRTLTLPRQNGSAVGMAITRESRFGFVGRSTEAEPPTGPRNVVFATDENGTLIFEEPIGPQETRWNAIAPGPEGSWLLAGTAPSDTEGNADEIAVARLDPDGALLDFSRFSYHPQVGIGYDILRLLDGRTVIAGSLCPDQPTFGGPNCDAIVRTVGP
jgi:hypothetical protein